MGVERYDGGRTVVEDNTPCSSPSPSFWRPNNCITLTVYRDNHVSGGNRNSRGGIP